MTVALPGTPLPHEGLHLAGGPAPHGNAALVLSDDGPGPDEGVFEGSEKKFQIDFVKTAQLGADGFRSVARATWDEVCANAKCTIISHKSNDFFDAFMLSESSLFVYPHKIIMKTCGTTALLASIPKLIAIGKGLGTSVEFVQYSRSTFMFPGQQPFPHSSFDHEVSVLDRYFDGDAYIFGPVSTRVNKREGEVAGKCWHLYVADYSERPAYEETDQTIEVFMWDLDREAMQQFFRPLRSSLIPSLASGQATKDHAPAPKPPGKQVTNGIIGKGCPDASSDLGKGLGGNGFIKVPSLGATAADSTSEAKAEEQEPDPDEEYSEEEATLLARHVTRASGIEKLMPGAEIDAFLFEPCGYSLNGLEGDAYYTIHITPEEECSYASFETNLQSRSYTSLVCDLISTFKPGRFSLSVFTDKGALPGRASRAFHWDTGVGGFRRANMSVHDFGGYDGAFGYFVSDRAGYSSRSLCPAPAPGLTIPSPARTSARSCSCSEEQDREVRTTEGAFLGCGSPFQDLRQAIARTFDVRELAAPPATDEGGVGLEGQVAALVEEAMLGHIASQGGMTSDSTGAFSVVDVGALERQYARWCAELPRVKPYYAVKCNNDPAILQTLAALGCNFDCASQREVETVTQLVGKCSGERIVYANPCKLPRHVTRCKDLGVELATFDNDSELYKMAELHPSCGLLLRIVTDDSESVCRLSNKYGATMTESVRLVALCSKLGLKLMGVSFHCGSGCNSSRSFVQAIQFARALFDIATTVGFGMRMLDIGGGFRANAAYGELSFEDTAAAIRPVLDSLFPTGSGVTLIAEPGRFFAAPAQHLAVHVIARRTAQPGPVEGGADEAGQEVETMQRRMRCNSGTCVEELGMAGEGGGAEPKYDKVKEEAERELAKAMTEDSRGEEESTKPKTEREREQEREYAYYVDDGVYGSFNCLLFDHAHVVPIPLLVASESTEAEADAATESEASQPPSRARRTHRSTVFGPTCDGLDCINQEVQLPEMQVGDWLRYMDMGAYTFSASTHFNGISPPLSVYVRTVVGSNGQAVQGS